MSQELKLGISRLFSVVLQLEHRYDDDVPLTTLRVVDASGVPTEGTVRVELDKLDTTFSTALVISF